jgi:hypothetical protein
MSDLNDRYPDDDVDQIAIARLNYRLLPTATGLARGVTPACWPVTVIVTAMIDDANHATASIRPRSAALAFLLIRKRFFPWGWCATGCARPFYIHSLGELQGSLRRYFGQNGQ